MPADTPDSPLYLLLSGAGKLRDDPAGISGAFILVLLGKYEFVLQAVVARFLHAGVDRRWSRCGHLAVQPRAALAAAAATTT